MVDVVYGTSSFDRDRGNFPKIPVINMFAEKAPTEQSVALQSRPGLEFAGITMGAGPVKSLFRIDGVLNDGLFGVSGGHLYSSGTDLGVIDGSGPARIAGFENLVFATSGAGLWAYNGTALSEVTTPDGFEVLSLCVGTSRLIVVDEGTGRFYWSDVLTSNVDALSFATAENSPDKLRDCLFIGDTLMLFGSETVEFWPANASNPDLPYQPLLGRTFQVGIRETGCCATFASTFSWITNRNQVCVGDVNTVISDSSLEEKISGSTTAKLWSFLLEGVEFLAVTLDTATWVFSSRSSQWSQFESYGETNWVPQCYASGCFGSSVDGQIIQWSEDHSDFGNQLERRFRAGIPITTGTVGLMNITIRTNPGQTPYLSGDYVDPKVELRTSRDGGFRWSEWKARLLGQNGQYQRKLVWRSLGFFSYPGAVLEFRVTDPVPFRISGISANETYGGI